MTKDEDFHRLSVLHGPPPKVIWIRLGNCSTDEVIRLLRRRRVPRPRVKTTKGRKVRTGSDKLRREYRFDYRKARPNRFATGFKGQTKADRQECESRV